MKPRHFGDFRQDLLDINLWREQRSLHPIVKEDLPSFGLIIDDVAAMFLRQCEGGIAMIDSVVSNPHASGDKRNEALDILFQEMIAAAKVFGMKALIGFSENYAFIDRSTKFGFKESGHKLMILDMGA